MSMNANRPPQVTFGGFSRRKKAIAPPEGVGDDKDEDSFDGSACDGHDVCRLGEYIDIGHDVCRLVAYGDPGTFLSFGCMQRTSCEISLGITM